ncbi:MAG: hypothetical protein K2X61_12640 [Caulobacteraceae bacterium]|nr:hypothetical protein [Caulobacteraceae bacterium]
MLRLALIALPAAVMALTACSPSEEAETAPDTAATTPEGAAPIMPGVGSPPEPGAGVPGSSNQSNDQANPDGTVADPVLPCETPNP